MRKRIMKTILCLVFALALMTPELLPFAMLPEASAVTQADIDKLKKEQDRLDEQKAELEADLRKLQKDKSSALSQKSNLDKQIGVLQSEISNREDMIRQYEGLISDTEEEIRQNEAEEAEQYERFCERVRAMEERGTVSYWSVLFTSADFSDLLASMDFISEIMESDQKVIENLRRIRTQIEEKKVSLESSLAEQEAAKAQLAEKNRLLAEQRKAAEKIVADIKANEKEYQAMISEMDAELDRQQEEIVRLSRELAAQSGNTTVTYGGYIWPCSSKYITSPLGARYTGIKGASTNHAGIDIGRVGYTTKAVAAKAGTVIVSSYNQYRGNYVVVSHGSGNTTTYQHLSKRSVAVGDYVAQGQAVGITGSTGVGSGPHLHFEITENGKIVNPLQYLTDYTKGWR